MAPIRTQALCPLLCVLLLAAPILAQAGGGMRTSREAMWPAPSAEDWKKPCLITWQRSYADALAVMRETQKPILVCVNMDGEIASEHYAGVRYREPKIAALYEPYVTVIASVYRHTPRDYDEEGRRILCPRFGSVTCGEHISIEPGLFEQFFEGQRVAPRHIGVELEGEEVYDVFYAFDTDTIFDALRDGIAKRQVVTRTLARGDRPPLERVASRHSLDRSASEAAYQSGDRALRRRLLGAALALGAAAPVDLLRLAVFGFDVELAALARRALAQSDSEGAIDLIVEALRVPMDAAERDALLAALARLGETWPRACTLAIVYTGLEQGSDAVDVELWRRALEAAAPPTTDAGRPELSARLEYGAGAASARPEDAAARLDLAEAFLALALDPATAPAPTAGSAIASKRAALLLEDARRAAQAAQDLGADGWRTSAVLALCAHYLGHADEAAAQAERAVQGLAAGEPGWNAMAVLALFAHGRRAAIDGALRDGSSWPSEWLADLHAAYAVLARHPLASDREVAVHHDFLARLGARGPAQRVLEEGLERFPDSWVLHDRLRGCALAERGVQGLEAAYAERLRRVDAHSSLEWFAGYASLVAAEFQRRAADPAAARVAYARAIDHYERSVAASAAARASADHYVALALAGRARLALEQGDLAGALDELCASFARCPAAAGTLDGLGLSAVATAQMLAARLADAQQSELAARLASAMAQLDPEALRLPDFERQGPLDRGARARRQR